MAHYVYHSHNPATSLSKVGRCEGRNGGRRLQDYLYRHGLSRDGWSPVKHYYAGTEAQAAKLEGSVHAQLRAAGRSHSHGSATELFKTTPTRPHFLIAATRRVLGLKTRP